jgi:thioesterase domain-containing protein/aryl carrier-like protein
MQSTGKGAALIVRISEHGALRYAVEPVALACVNGPELVLLTGPEGAIAETERRLAADGVAYKRPPIDVAVHSSCMDAILPAFREALAGLTLQPATRPILSTVFAEWLEPAHAAERDYWAAQIRKPVHFDRAGQRLFEAPCCVVLEVGLGAALSGLLAGKRADKLQQRALAALGPLEEGGVYPEDRLERCLAELWANGVPVDLAGGAAAPESAPILPAYAFQRQRCWIDAPEPAARGAEGKRAPAPPSPEVAGRAAMAPAQLAVMHAISQLSRLPLAKLDPSTTFMEMGLDSLFLAQLAEALRASTGVTLTLADLVRDNTIERVALLLGARAEAMKGVAAPVSRAMPQVLPSQLVQLRAGDPHNPVLFIHGDAADRFLPPYLPRGQSLYGYLHQGADGGRIQHTRVEDLAAQCHQEWLQICGEEPCVLGGHSFGGLVAYHVAHLRRKAGLPVSLVVMIDTHHPITFRNADRLDPRRPRRWLQEMRVAARRHRDRAHAEALLLLGKTIPPELRPDYHMAVYDSAARLYEPPPLEVDVLFFHADAGFYGRADRYWDAVVRGRLEVHPSRADHLTIVRVPETFDPVARILAERLASLHSRVEEARGGRTAPAPTM